jgi:ribosomal protein L20
LIKRKEGSPLDITQIPLKINQTSLSDSPKLKAEFGPGLNRFIDVLSGQFLKSETEINSDVNLEIASDQQLTAEDWEELETILAEVLSIFKEIKSLIGPSAEQMNSFIPSDEPQININPSTLNLQYDIVENPVTRKMNTVFQQSNEEELESGRKQTLNIPGFEDGTSSPLNSREKISIPLELQTIKMASTSIMNDQQDRGVVNPSFQQVSKDWEPGLDGKIEAKPDAMKEQEALKEILRENVTPSTSNKTQISEMPSYLNIKHGKVNQLDNREVIQLLNEDEEPLGLNEKLVGKVVPTKERGQGDIQQLEHGPAGIDRKLLADTAVMQEQKQVNSSAEPMETPKRAQSTEKLSSLNVENGKAINLNKMAIHTELQQIENESKIELDSIIEPVQKVIKEIQNLTANSDEQSSKASLDKSNNFIMNSIFILQDDMVDILNNLGLWLQKLKAPSQTLGMDFNQIMEGLAQFVTNEPDQKNQKSFSVPEPIRSNIQQLIDEFDYQVEVQPLDKNAFSIDKDQMFVSANSNNSSALAEENRLQQNQRVEAPTSHIVQQEPLLQPDSVNSPKSTSIPVPEFANRMSEWIGRNISMHNGRAGNAETRLLLNPGHLGPVEIKISFDENGQLSAQILTDTAPTKEILETQLQQLKQNLQQQGLVVLKLDVLQQGQMQDSNQAGMMFNEDGSNSSREHQNPQQSHEKLSKNQNESSQKELEKDQAAFTYGSAAHRLSTQIDFSA